MQDQLNIVLSNLEDSAVFRASEAVVAALISSKSLCRKKFTPTGEPRSNYLWINNCYPACYVFEHDAETCKIYGRYPFLIHRQKRHGPMLYETRRNVSTSVFVGDRMRVGTGAFVNQVVDGRIVVCDEAPTLLEDEQLLIQTARDRRVIRLRDE